MSASGSVGGGVREKLRVYEGKPASEQVRFTESVTAATDPEFKLPLFLERKTQSFPHLRVNQLRVFTKPAFWNGPLVARTRATYVP